MANVNNSQVTPGGWTRIALYAATVIVALIAVLLPAFGLGDAVGIAEKLAAVLGILSGGTAVLNVPKADDQNIKLRDLLPAVGELVGEVRGLRQESATPADVVDEVQARFLPQPAAETTPGEGGTAFSAYHKPQ